MNRSAHVAAQKRRAEIEAYGAPSTRIQFAGSCGCGCGTKFRAHEPGDLVKWFGKWVLVPCVRRALDTSHAWSSRLDSGLRVLDVGDDLDRGERKIRAGHYLGERMRRARRALVAKSVAANGRRS